MSFSRDNLFRAAYWAALGSAASILLSIWASERMLEISLALLLFSRARLRVPRIWLPVVLFMAGTLISLAFSPDPRLGWPPVKKLYLFSMVLVLYTVVRELKTVRRLVLTWAGIGGFVSLWAIVQFVQDWRMARALHENFYSYYLPRRITGAMSHWMTFAGEEMLVLLMVAAFLLFGPVTRRRWACAGCAGFLGFAILLNQTRTVWIALALAGVFLMWWRSRLLAVVAPALLLAFLWVVPGPVHERFVSIVKPHEKLDSNSFRYVMNRTGLEIIKAHPLLGLGPEELKYHLKEWIPADLSHDLPSGFYQHLHNFYLQYAAERGIPTMLAMVGMLVLAFSDFARAARKLPAGRSDARFVLLGAMACVVGIMVSGLAEHNLGDSEVLVTFLAVLAFGYVAVDAAQAKMADTTSTPEPVRVSGMEFPSL